MKSRYQIELKTKLNKNQVVGFPSDRENQDMECIMQRW